MISHYLKEIDQLIQTAINSKEFNIVNESNREHIEQSLRDWIADLKDFQEEISDE